VTNNDADDDDDDDDDDESWVRSDAFVGDVDVVATASPARW
jgi:hypothetical protein